MATARHERRWLIPEVVQTSAMDCGPAALACLLQGFGVPASYGRLREVCQTDVDGTSIDTLETVARQLGLDAEQIMLPADTLLLPEAAALPALVVTRLPNGFTHFVVVWRRHRRWVQVMDPGVGRRWLHADRLLRDVFVHTMRVPAAGWRAWATSAEAQAVFRRRFADLGAGRDAGELLAAACRHPTWEALAAVDAALRLSERLASAGALSRGPRARGFLTSLARRALENAAAARQLIPPPFWSVQPAPASGDGAERLFLRGAVLVRARGQLAAARDADRAPSSGAAAHAGAAPPALEGVLAASKASALREVYRLLRADGALRIAGIGLAVLTAAASVTVEALMLRGAISVGQSLRLIEQRLEAGAYLLVFCVALLLLEIGIAGSVLSLGRRMDVRLRAAFGEKIPRLHDRYLESRPASDMAERSHAIHQLRLLPRVGAQILQLLAQMAITTLALLWLAPGSSGLVVASFVISLGVPLALLPILQEQDLRIRTHNGALGRFYLDALLGLMPIRSHGAESAVRREHEGLLVEWMRAGRERLRVLGTFVGVQAVVSLGLGAWLFFQHTAGSEDAASALLLVYWVLLLQSLGIEFAFLAQQYPTFRSTVLRLTEPLGAPEDDRAPPRRPEQSGAEAPAAVELCFERVSVRAGGHTILDGVDVRIPRGAHVAIVGASGAGKSTFIGTLLGWHRPFAGRVLADGHELDAAGLAGLRSSTAWLDPAVQLWNATLVDNLLYGGDDDAIAGLGEVLAEAQLHTLVERLPAGLQSVLGEHGGLVSGGEGQRVRVARAMLRHRARLVLIDEPFRGLDHDRRRELLAAVRRRWRGATLLCVTHDIADTADFHRVLVFDSGRVVEDGEPAALARDERSAYAALLRKEAEMRAAGWGHRSWRRLRLRSGKVDEAEESR